MESRLLHLFTSTSIALALTCAAHAQVPGKSYNVLVNWRGNIRRMDEPTSLYLVPQGSKVMVRTVKKKDEKVFFQVTEVGSSTASNLVNSADLYYVASADWTAAEDGTVSRVPESPVVTGALTIPFRFQLKDSKLTAGSSLGFYVGVRKAMRSHSVDLGSATFLVSAGLSLVPTQSVENTTPETKTGLAGAVGLLLEPVDKFQIGVMFGSDFLGKGSDYRYNGTPWISFSIGYKFSG